MGFLRTAIPWDIAEDYELAEDELAKRSPLNYSEAIIVLPGTDANENQIGRFFQTFYNGFLGIIGLGCLTKMNNLGSHSPSILSMMHSTRIMT
jgi:hypothetical protein